MPVDEIPVRKLICNIAEQLADIEGALPKDVVAVIQNKPNLGVPEMAFDAETRYEAAVVKALLGGDEVLKRLRSDEVQNFTCATILSNLTSRYPNIDSWSKDMLEVLPRAANDYFDSIPKAQDAISAPDAFYYHTFGIAACIKGGNERAAELANQAQEKAKGK